MKVLVGMSGGVDSTVAVLKLLEAGHTVEGAVLAMHDYTEIDAAKDAAKSLGIPLSVVDCRERFEEAVVSDFLASYAAGKTPNPCVVCNSEVKFAELLSFAEQNGFDRIATGHYAAVEKTPSGFALRRAKDAKKDQTYMLWRLSQPILSRLLLPLSNAEKPDVRAAAHEKGLATADRGDSQEICFIPDHDYAAFIERRLGAFPHGDFVDGEGKVLGEHKGIIRYTVGQRKGLGVSFGERVFVTKIDPLANTVTLSPTDSFADSVEAAGVVFSGFRPEHYPAEISCFVKLRYAAPPVPACATFSEDGRAHIRTEIPVRAVTPGQSAVFYDEKGLLLAGGEILSASLSV